MGASKAEVQATCEDAMEKLRRMRAYARWGLYRIAQVETRLDTARGQGKIGNEVYAEQRREISELRAEVNDMLRTIQQQRTHVAGWLVVLETGRKHLL